MKKRGYLLLEMVFALAFMSTSFLIIAALQGQIAMSHKQAEQYLMATTFAKQILLALQQGKKVPSIPQGFSTTIQETRLEQSSLFILYTITVSFTSPCGTPQKVIIDGGRFRAPK